MASWRQTALLFSILGLLGGQSRCDKIDLKKHIQPDRVKPEEFQNPKPHQCARNCDGGLSKTCYYKWTAEAYVTMGPQCGDCPRNTSDCSLPQCVAANGHEKSILTINRMVPGPAIEVCLYDRIIIDLTNNIPGAELAIHWHGVFQKGTPHMDGVPMLTQCPISEGETFRYDFIAQNEGTHFWHSHDGIQKLDGIQGSLIIRTPNDTNRQIYDADQTDHVLMILDWMNTTALDRFPGPFRREPGQLPHSFLLNGVGPSKIIPGLQDASQVPYKEIWIKRGKKYRFRFIGALCTICGVELSIQDHEMTLVATDGTPVKPVSVGAVQMFSGERYDMVINANQPEGSYWIHMRGLAECADLQIYQLALLRYYGTNETRKDPPGYTEGFRKGKVVLNPQNATCADQNGVCVTQLESLLPDKNNIISAHPDVNLDFKFGFKFFQNETLKNGFFNTGRYDRYLVAPGAVVLTSWINNISFMQPPAPLLSQREDIPREMLCPERKKMPQCPAKDAGKEYCECIHVIKIPLGKIVQIILRDSSPAVDLHHPFHLHGNDFYVMAMGQFKDGQTLEDINELLENTIFSKPPALKDTIAVPSNGYAVIRFQANNPGAWFFHCHFMYHVATGMAVVLQVGEKDEWPAVPKNFPKCGNYKPDKNIAEYLKMLAHLGI